MITVLGMTKPPAGMMKPPAILRAPRKAVLGLLVVLAAHACNQGDASYRDKWTKGDKPSSKITYVAPTPAPIEIFWIDSAGNLGLRGVEAVVPGAPLAIDDPKAGKLPPTCRESATKNGNGTLTICMSPTVGRVLAEKLGLEWTSGTSTKP